MANIRSVEQLGPVLYDRTLLGTVVQVGSVAGVLGVNVQGNVIAARWADPVVASVGDTVLVQLMIGKTGQTEAFVKGKVISTPRPSRGVVSSVPPSSPTVSVVGTDGVTYTAFFVTSYAPVATDEVFLSWFGSRPTIVGKVAATAAPVSAPPPPPAPLPPPPPPPQVGTANYAAAESSTYWAPGGWGSWAGGRGRVYQGNYGSGEVTGAWFYRQSPTQLAGRAITRAQFILGGRINAGSYNSPATIHLYLTADAYRPGGDCTFIHQMDVTAWPGQGPTVYELPVDWGAHFVEGAGMAMKWNPYAGFYGVNEQPDSGKLILDWRIG